MFNKSNFCHIASNNRNEQKGSVFIYKTTDTLAQVTQNGYFNEKLIDINLHDLIIHVQYNPVNRTMKKSVLIVTERTLDNVATQPITDETILNDLGDLGEQVAEIEGKIPSNASATNQLATQNDITNKITNCITKIPQDIKLELADGTLTLKAGSKVYVPNGAGVFDVVNIANDISNSGNTAKAFAITDGSVLLWTNKVSSGGTAPESPSNGQIWYDTTNNVVKRYSTGSGTWVGGFSLPIALLNPNATTLTTITEMQVFNGFGYIGSTVFVLPGVKGLIPNGRNADGTLKNISANSYQIYTYTRTSATNPNIALTMSGGGYIEPSSFMAYDAEANIYTMSGTPVQRLVVGKISFGDGGKITSFELKTAFHAVDYGDTEFIAHQAMPSDSYIDLTLPAAGGSVIAPADGYLFLDKKSTAANQRIFLINDTGGKVRSACYSAATNDDLVAFVPCSKGDSVRILYDAAGTTSHFKFVYANGAK